MSEHAPMPAWVDLDHAGLSVRLAPKRQDYGWTMFLAGLTAFWTGMSCFGLSHDGLRCATVAIAGLSPVLWLLTLMMGLDLATRRELRLAADGLTVTVRRFGVPSRTRLDLRSLTVIANHHFGGKGFTNTSLTLVEEAGRRPRKVHFPLPGALYLPERERALAELQWMTDALRSAAEIARRLPDAADEPEQSRALGELLERIGGA